MKDFDEALVFADLIVNQNRAVQEFANACAFSNGGAHAREPRQQLDMVDKRTSEACSRVGIIVRDMADDGGKIV